MWPNTLALRELFAGTSGSHPARSHKNTGANNVGPCAGSYYSYNSHKIYPKSQTTTQGTTNTTSIYAAYNNGSGISGILDLLPSWTDIINHEGPPHQTDYDAFQEAALSHFLDGDVGPSRRLGYNADVAVDKENSASFSSIDSKNSKSEPLQPICTTPARISPNRSTPSSLVVLTPPNGSSSNTKSNSGSISSESGHAISGDSVSTEQLYREAAQHSGGPCSNVWQLSQWRTRTSKKGATKKLAHKRGHDDIDEQPRRRPFQDPQQRETTALTRRLKACIRCRMQKIRCEPDPDNLFGPCLTCKSVGGPTVSSLNCLRYIITDTLLYRQQNAPYQLFSKRWQSMDLVDIQDWAADEIKTITISQIFLDAPYEVDVRKFVPHEGDMLEDAWCQNGHMKKYKIPRYALADLAATAAMLEEFIDRNIVVYINGAVSGSDPLIWKTYLMAFRHLGQAQTSKEKDLMLDTFRLWVACRKTSNPHCIRGDDKLGAPTVRDPGSLFHNVVPMPVIIIAQMELIMYSRVLRPVSKRVLDSLQALMLEQKPRYWYTIYLCCFVLLHSCAMQTKRDEEVARQYNLKERYANPYSIQGHHSGAQTILAHWHYVNKGSKPFQKALSRNGLKEVKGMAQLTDEQADFIGSSAQDIREKSEIMSNARDWVAFGNDWYWVSQLFDQNWVPGETA